VSRLRETVHNCKETVLLFTRGRASIKSMARSLHMSVGTVNGCRRPDSWRCVVLYQVVTAVRQGADRVAMGGG
jgi:hypothetical protein